MQEGLVKALQSYCKSISKPPYFNLHFQDIGTIPPLAPIKALSLYRMVQELVHNALKHGKATEVMVEIAEENDALLLISVDDNGNGWITNPDTSGIGSESLQKRVAMLSGTIDIDNRPGAGVTIYLSFNIKELEIS